LTSFNPVDHVIMSDTLFKYPENHKNKK